MADIDFMDIGVILVGVLAIKYGVDMIIEGIAGIRKKEQATRGYYDITYQDNRVIGLTLFIPEAITLSKDFGFTIKVQDD